MQCPNCGAPCSGKFCEYCGNVLPYEGPKELKVDNSTHVVNNYYMDPRKNVISDPAEQPEEIFYTESYATVSEKNTMTALLLCIFLGTAGAHRFYVGRIGSGLLYMFTGGLLGIGWVVDIIGILTGSFKDSQGLPLAGSRYDTSGFSAGTEVRDRSNGGRKPSGARKGIFFGLMVFGLMGVSIGLSSGDTGMIGVFAIWAAAFFYLWKKAA